MQKKEKVYTPEKNAVAGEDAQNACGGAKKVASGRPYLGSHHAHQQGP